MKWPSTVTPEIGDKVWIEFFGADINSMSQIWPDGVQHCRRGKGICQACVTEKYLRSRLKRHIKFSNYGIVNWSVIKIHQLAISQVFPNKHRCLQGICYCGFSISCSQCEQRARQLGELTKEPDRNTGEGGRGGGPDVFVWTRSDF